MYKYKKVATLGKFYVTWNSVEITWRARETSVMHLEVLSRATMTSQIPPTKLSDFTIFGNLDYC